MKQLLGALLVFAFVFAVSPIEAKKASFDKETFQKVDQVSNTSFENDLTIHEFTFVASPGSGIDMSMDNTCEYAQPVAETCTGHYNYATFRHRNPGDYVVHT